MGFVSDTGGDAPLDNDGHPSDRLARRSGSDSVPREQSGPRAYVVDEAMPVRVTNTAIGMIRKLLQVGIVNGGLHVHLPRRAGTAMLIAVWLPALIAVASLVAGDSTRWAEPQSATGPQRTSEAQEPTTTTTTPAAMPDPPALPPVYEAEVRTVTVVVPGDPPAVLDGIRISVETAGFTSTHDGAVRCGGGGNGPGGGGCVAIGGDTLGTSTVGIIDFSVITPALTCKTSSVHVNESVVLAQPSGGWARIVVLSIGPHNPATGKLPVSFEVSRGHSAPAPQSPKVCVPS